MAKFESKIVDGLFVKLENVDNGYGMVVATIESVNSVVDWMNKPHLFIGDYTEDKAKPYPWGKGIRLTIEEGKGLVPLLKAVVNEEGEEVGESVNVYGTKVKVLKDFGYSGRLRVTETKWGRFGENYGIHPWDDKGVHKGIRFDKDVAVKLYEALDKYYGAEPVTEPETPKVEQTATDKVKALGLDPDKLTDEQKEILKSLGLAFAEPKAEPKTETKQKRKPGRPKKSATEKKQTDTKKKPTPTEKPFCDNQIINDLVKELDALGKPMSKKYKNGKELEYLYDGKGQKGIDEVVEKYKPLVKDMDYMVTDSGNTFVYAEVA